MGNVRVRIMIMKSGHDRIFFEEEHGGPSTCPNEFRSELHDSDFGGPGSFKLRENLKAFTPHGGRLLYFFFCWWFAAGPAMPAREQRCCRPQKSCG
jgi:hypothetical protein